MPIISGGGGSGGGGALVFAHAPDVATDESTASTSFTDLATVGPTVSIAVGASGLLLVGWNAELYNAQGVASIALSGANTVAASDAVNLFNGGTGGPDTGFGRSYVFSGLTAGTTTITVKYRAISGTAHFLRRSMWAIAP